MKPSSNSGFGTVFLLLAVGIIGVIVVVAFGIFDLAKLKKPQQTMVEQEDSQVKELNVLGVSDEIGDIEKYLDQTNLDKLDQEIPQVDKDAGSL